MEPEKMQVKSISTIGFSELISLISLFVVTVSFLWNIFYGYGTLNAKVDALQDDVTEFKQEVRASFEKVDRRLEKIETDLHKLDLRVTTLEQKRP